MAASASLFWLCWLFDDLQNDIDRGFFPFFNESKWLNNKIEKENYFLIMIFTFMIQKIIKQYWQRNIRIRKIKRENTVAFILTAMIKYKQKRMEEEEYEEMDIFGDCLDWRDNE